MSYYGLPTALHLGIFAGSGIGFKKIAIYYEIGTTDRDLAAYVTNKTAIPFFDIMNVGVGATFHFPRPKPSKKN